MNSLVPDVTYDITGRDKRTFEDALKLTYEHHSGGSYNMAAIYQKGGRRLIGLNRLDRPALLAHPGYPEMHGMHAELAAWMQSAKVDWNMRGGTMYVAGSKRKNDSTMPNTRPCAYCAALLVEAGINYVVFQLDGVLIKTSPIQLVNPMPS